MEWNGIRLPCGEKRLPPCRDELSLPFLPTFICRGVAYSAAFKFRNPNFDAQCICIGMLETRMDGSDERNNGSFLERKQNEYGTSLTIKVSHL
jgi:hypothetical protein